MLAYVTVGSTGFDQLIGVISTPAFLRALSSRGFRRLVVQYGSSSKSFNPPSRVPETLGLSIEHFDYTRWPQQYVDNADLIISHAGTGCILEALHAGKPTIVVPNHDLMDAHQAEIAEELAHGGYLLVTEVELLHKVVEEGGFAGLAPYPHADPRPIGEILDEETI
ncbi:glycosyl transferase [Kickxella alabastrina]|uniref:glycosyl transferase n=1 Tax=Kickxella alabastrina TaxID=61397 RepID=UPI00221F829A|nr:glycosyl transferase [Kickxella alabastrina]KAI7834270.1 glycosyl transferase [Kickxella alabastrina]KAJ1933835.1 hypothetical protein GGF37_006589 [Kickxella alabastrina]